MRKLILIGLLLISSLACLGQIKYTTSEILTKYQILEKTDLNKAFFGDDFYYKVDANSLEDIKKSFKDTLKNLGLEDWDERFDCNHLTSLYIQVAQAKFAAANLNISPKLQETLAMGEIWYVRSSNGLEHAVVIMYSSLGVIYIDPTDDCNRVFLTDREKKSIFFNKW